MDKSGFTTSLTELLLGLKKMTSEASLTSLSQKIIWTTKMTKRMNSMKIKAKTKRKLKVKNKNLNVRTLLLSIMKLKSPNSTISFLKKLKKARKKASF